MKKITLLSLIIIVFISNLMSQAPNLMSYQAVIWDAGGNLVSEKTVNIKISILQGSVTGTSIYSETHRVQTNVNGLVSLMIGGGTNSSGKISDINWGGGSFFLKTETDPAGGTSFIITGTTLLVSVPYSLLANNLATPKPGLPGQILSADKDGKPIWVSIHPSILTNSSINIPPNASTSGGNVISDGGSPVIARGVVWSTNPNPTISLSTKTTDGSGLGTFSSELQGLSSNTTYYVRAYATNISGTGYGNEVTFTSLANLPLLFTTAVSSITPSSAISGGNVTSDGGKPVLARGVVWSTSPNPTISLSTKTIDGTGLGLFVSNIFGLNPNTIYYVKAYATNVAGTSYGSNELIFNTSITCAGSPTVKDTSGNVYNTVQIGTQCWMKENLKTTKYSNGEIVPNIIVEREKLITGSWSYLLDDSYYNNEFGKLYNWYSASDSRGICPKGWHLPSVDEWQILRNFVGETPAFKLKERSNWNTTYFDAETNRNSSNFSAKAGGSGEFEGLYNKSFSGLTTAAIFWTSNSYDNLNAYVRVLYSSSSEFASNLGAKTTQRSIRCLKD